MSGMVAARGIVVTRVLPKHAVQCVMYGNARHMDTADCWTAGHLDFPNLRLSG